MRWFCWCGLALLQGCGYVGDPLPPALHIPVAVSDLAAFQRGSKLVLRFTAPQLTTENLPIPAPGEIDLRIGAAPEGAFNVNTWAPAATRVPALKPEVRTDVSSYAGKEIFAAVRTAGSKGRWSDWSNVVAIRIVQPLATPAAFMAEAAPGGVQLQWTLTAPPETRYRIFRQADKEEALTLLATVTASPFLDGAAEYEKPYKYQVQAVLANGDRQAESEPSSIAEITPRDTFPPPTPTGLNALAGVNTIELAWDPGTDPGLAGYHVYRARNGAFERIGDLTEAPAFSDRSAESGATYRYAVTAVDQKGNESPKSEPVEQKLP